MKLDQPGEVSRMRLREELKIYNTANYFASHTYFQICPLNPYLFTDGRALINWEQTDKVSLSRHANMSSCKIACNGMPIND